MNSFATSFKVTVFDDSIHSEADALNAFSSLLGIDEDAARQICTAVVQNDDNAAIVLISDRAACDALRAKLEALKFRCEVALASPTDELAFATSAQTSNTFSTPLSSTSPTAIARRSPRGLSSTRDLTFTVVVPPAWGHDPKLAALMSRVDPMRRQH
jgi:hypothetical protein